MFTGLVQGMGRVAALSQTGGQMRLTIQALFNLPDIVLGESIAVNGVCLTVESGGDGAFSAYASAETLSATTLGGLRQGALVNLERALALGDRLGGHLVSGHVDCLARVSGVDKVGESIRFELTYPVQHAGCVVQKGSVALDGISLTINDCGADWLSVNIIPATQKETTIASWKQGVSVNMETDIIGKYVARMMMPYGQAKQSNITEAFLRDNGF